MRTKLTVLLGAICVCWIAQESGGEPTGGVRRSVRSAAPIPSYRPVHEKYQPPGAASSAKNSRDRSSSIGLTGFAMDAGYDASLDGCATCGDCDAPCDSPCSGGACGGCQACNAVPRFWGKAEYLLWWTDGADTPALATSSAGSFNQASAGVRGQPNTSILFGGEPMHQDARSGVRLTLGMWLDDWNQCGLEGSYLSLQDDEESFVGSNPNFVVLARPFFNVQAGAEDARLIVFPDLTSGILEIRSNTEFETYDVFVRRMYRQSCLWSMETLVGYRGANLRESVDISESTLGLAGPAQGAEISLRDRFATENQFHGGQLGLRWLNQQCNDWSVEVVTKVALGNTRSRVAVTGNTTTTVNGTDTNSQAGLLAQGTNIRSLESNEFSTLSEFGLSLRRHFACDLTFQVGYTFMHWSDVLRAGELIDTNINPTQIPPGTLTGAASPALSLDTQSFWAQGLTVGLEYLF